MGIISAVLGPSSGVGGVTSSLHPSFQTFRHGKRRNVGTHHPTDLQQCGINPEIRRTFGHLLPGTKRTSLAIIAPLPSARRELGTFFYRTGNYPLRTSNPTARSVPVFPQRRDFGGYFAALSTRRGARAALPPAPRLSQASLPQK